MNNSLNFITGRYITEDKCLYAANYYFGDFIEINFLNNRIKTIVLDEQGVYLIYAIYSDGEKIVMYPRNGRKIHIINCKSYEKEIVELHEKISDYTFPIFYDNKLLVFERQEKYIWLIDYSSHKIEKILEYKEKHNFTNFKIYQDEVLLSSPDTNSVYIYSFKSQKGRTIWFTDEISGITKMYRFNEYFVGYNRNDNSIIFFDSKGKRIINYETRFKSRQVEPYIYQKNTNTLCFLGNTNGIVYEINIKDRIMIKKNIEKLDGKDIFFFQETDEKVYGIEITKTYDQILKSVYEIDKQRFNLEILTVNYLKKENGRKYEMIKKYINNNNVIKENKAINIEHLIHVV